MSQVDVKIYVDATGRSTLENVSKLIIKIFQLATANLISHTWVLFYGVSRVARFKSLGGGSPRHANALFYLLMCIVFV